MVRYPRIVDQMHDKSTLGKLQSKQSLGLRGIHPLGFCRLRFCRLRLLKDAHRFGLSDEFLGETGNEHQRPGANPAKLGGIRDDLKFMRSKIDCGRIRPSPKTILIRHGWPRAQGLPIVSYRIGSFLPLVFLCLVDKPLPIFLLRAFDRLECRSKLP